MANQPSKYNKILLGAASAALVASAVAPVASAATADFSDIKGNTHEAAIKALVEAKVINGYEDGTFKPNKTLTRSDVVKMMGKWLVSLGYEVPADYKTNIRFTDQTVNTNEELLKYSAVVKDNGVFNGYENGSLDASGDITRENMALVLVRAYDAIHETDLVALVAEESFTKDVTDRAAAKAEARPYIDVLDFFDITNPAAPQFNPKNTTTRGQFASFLHKTSLVEVEKLNKAGIASVEAINDTTVRVTFGQAIDEDFIREAEKDGEYFRLYLVGDSAYSDNAVKSATITFSNDGKTAEFTLGEELDGDDAPSLESGKRYSVALTNGNNKTADIVHEFGPVELKASAAAPSFDVSALSDKIIVKYGEKMKSEALDVDNYEVFDEGGKKLGDLEDFLVDGAEGKWVDATQKTQVEFSLYSQADGVDNSKEQLHAGKTYKLHVKDAVKTDKNKTLSAKDRTITVKTPSIKDAQPKAVTARVADTDEIVVVFDQDVVVGAVNAAQIDVKTSTGKTVTVNGVDEGTAANELVIQTANELDHDVTYRVSLPANAVTNGVFPNAANETISNLSAKAQADIEIKSVKAELKADPKNKEQANLYLTFDQRPNLSQMDWSKAVIEDGSDVYDATNAAVNAKYVDEKTIVVENVYDSFDNFKPENGENYIFEIGAGAVETDSFGDGNGKTNQSKLKTTFGGVSVTAPKVDRVTLVSDNEIKIDFKEDISSVSVDDVFVRGIELYTNGNFANVTLNGTEQLSSSVSGNSLTLKTKGNASFLTGFDNDFLIEIKANSFTSKGSLVENAKVEIEGTGNGLNVNGDSLSKAVDNAGPVLIGAYAGSNDEQIELTFTEDVERHGDLDRIATLFSVKNAANNAVGESLSVSGNEVVVTFNDEVFDEDTVLNRIEVKYTSGNAFYLKDERGNKSKTATIKGVRGENPGSTPQ